jgi:hypothetical protein
MPRRRWKWPTSFSASCEGSHRRSPNAHTRARTRARAPATCPPAHPTHTGRTGLVGSSQVAAAAQAAAAASEVREPLAPAPWPCASAALTLRSPGRCARQRPRALHCTALHCTAGRATPCRSAPPARLPGCAGRRGVVFSFSGGVGMFGGGAGSRPGAGGMGRDSNGPRATFYSRNDFEREARREVRRPVGARSWRGGCGCGVCLGLWAL